MTPCVFIQRWLKVSASENKNITELDLLYAHFCTNSFLRFILKKFHQDIFENFIKTIKDINQIRLVDIFFAHSKVLVQSILNDTQSIEPVDLQNNLECIFKSLIQLHDFDAETASSCQRELYDYLHHEKNDITSKKFSYLIHKIAFLELEAELHDQGKHNFSAEKFYFEILLESIFFRLLQNVKPEDLSDWPNFKNLQEDENHHRAYGYLFEKMISIGYHPLTISAVLDHVFYAFPLIQHRVLATNQGDPNIIFADSLPEALLNQKIMTQEKLRQKHPSFPVFYFQLHHMMIQKLSKSVMETFPESVLVHNVNAYSELFSLQEYFVLMHESIKFGYYKLFLELFEKVADSLVILPNNCSLDARVIHIFTMALILYSESMDLTLQKISHLKASDYKEFFENLIERMILFRAHRTLILMMERYKKFISCALWQKLFDALQHDDHQGLWIRYYQLLLMQADLETILEVNRYLSHQLLKNTRFYVYQFYPLSRLALVNPISFPFLVMLSSALLDELETLSQEVILFIASYQISSELQLKNYFFKKLIIHASFKKDMTKVALFLYHLPQQEAGFLVQQTLSDWIEEEKGNLQLKPMYVFLEKSLKKSLFLEIMFKMLSILPALILSERQKMLGLFSGLAESFYKVYFSKSDFAAIVSLIAPRTLSRYYLHFAREFSDMMSTIVNFFSSEMSVYWPPIIYRFSSQLALRLDGQASLSDHSDLTRKILKNLESEFDSSLIISPKQKTFCLSQLREYTEQHLRLNNHSKRNIELASDEGHSVKRRKTEFFSEVL